jgi:hypothetical protein
MPYSIDASLQRPLPPVLPICCLQRSLPPPRPPPWQMPLPKGVMRARDPARVSHDFHLCEHGQDRRQHRILLHIATVFEHHHSPPDIALTSSPLFDSAFSGLDASDYNTDFAESDTPHVVLITDTTTTVGFPIQIQEYEGELMEIVVGMKILEPDPLPFFQLPPRDVQHASPSLSIQRRIRSFGQKNSSSRLLGPPICRPPRPSPWPSPPLAAGVGAVKQVAEEESSATTLLIHASSPSNLIPQR